jgi:phosphatidylinositol alpha-1,6-mannosyltransferase
VKVLFLSPGLFDKGGIARYGRYQVRAVEEAFGKDALRALSLVGPAAGDLEGDLDVAWCGPSPVSRGSRARMVWASLVWAFRFRPDVVLTGHVNLGPLGRWAARVGGGRLVQTVYGIEIWSGLPAARARALRGADRVIADCHNTADVAVRLGLRRVKPDVVWDCVDLERYRPGASSPEVLRGYGIERDGRFRILFLGRIAADARYKGTDRMLRLLARLPADRFEGVFAGKGDDVPFLRQLAAELGVGDRVRFAGAIHEDHMADVYRSADAFYLTSEVGPGRGEGLPLTPIEAMACGAPVLVGDQDGSREILDGAGGWMGAPGDLEAQAAYLRRLALDPATLDRERRSARERAEAAFGFEGFAGATCRVLKEV